MVKSPTKWIKALLAPAIGSATRTVLAETVTELAGALIDLRPTARTSSLPGFLRDRGIPDDTLADAWTRPDAVWIAVTRDRPALQYYPFGECAERAFKRLLVELSPPGERLPFKKALLGKPVEALLEDLFALFFFEVSMDQLRRLNEPEGGYCLSAANGAVSIPSERKFRSSLLRACRSIAQRFLQELAKDGAPPRLPFPPEVVSAAFEKVVGEKPRRVGKERTHSPLNVIVGPSASDCREVLEDLGAASRYTGIRFDSDRRNASYTTGGFEEALGGRRPSLLVRDLLDLGVAVYLTDLYTGRSKNLERRTNMYLPLRCPDAWRPARDQISRILADLGREEFEISIVKGSGPSRRKQHRIRSDNRCVCLFSGGLDSLAGAVWALQNGQEPVFVSHYSRKPLAAVQSNIIEKLGTRFKPDLSHIAFYASKRRVKGKGKDSQPNWKTPPYPLKRKNSPMAQHLRSFLFLSLATAVALELGIQRVYMFECGPVALNPLLSEGRVNTQTAHPHVLAGFQALVRSVFGVDLKILNPFQYLTKGQVAEFLAHPQLFDLVDTTESCWSFNTGLVANRLGLTWEDEHHDGFCLPCIIRKTAVHAAGLWPYDASYLVDVFEDYPNLPDDTVLAISDLLRFCRKVLACGGAELLSEVPELSVFDENTDPRKLVVMLRNHAREVRDCFRVRGNKQLLRDFAPLV